MHDDLLHEDHHDAVQNLHTIVVFRTMSRDITVVAVESNGVMSRDPATRV